MSQNKDGCYTHIHRQRPRDADLFEDFCKDKLPADDIFVLPHHQPINPEDEDDVVPDQHAAFGITKATQKTREAAWKDLGLAEMMHRGPAGAPSSAPAAAAAGGSGFGLVFGPAAAIGHGTGAGAGPTGGGPGAARRAAKKMALRYQGMPR